MNDQMLSIVLKYHPLSLRKRDKKERTKLNSITE